jgi:hypothetical protein
MTQCTFNLLLEQKKILIFVEYVIENQSVFSTIINSL